MSWFEANNEWSSSAVILCCSISCWSLVRLILSTISKNRTATHIAVRVGNILLFLYSLLVPDSPRRQEDSQLPLISLWSQNWSYCRLVEYSPEKATLYH